MRKLLILLFLLSGCAFAQNYNVNVGGISYTSGPSVPGSCPKEGSWFFKNTVTTGWYQCVGGVYVAVPTGSTGSVPFSGITSGTNNSAAMVVDSAASLSPTHIGPIIGTETWMRPGLVAPALSTSTSGGSIAAGHVIHVVVTYNTALGETLPSVEATITTGAGGTNSVTVTAPTLPSGYTGYTVYDYDANAGGTTWLRQTATAACVNITGNCVIGVPGAGANAPVLNTAWAAPANAQSFNGMLGEMPSVYFPKPDGNYYPWITTDWSTSNNFAAGTPTFTHRTFATDLGNGLNTSPAYGSLVTTQQGNNAFWSINHLFGVNTSTSNQDRALWVSGATKLHDTTTHYGLEAIQAELDYNCDTCSINGSPDGEVTTISSQLSTANAAVDWTTTGYQTNAIQGRLFRSGAGRDTAGMYGVAGEVSNSNTTWTTGSELVALHAKFSSTANATNMVIGGLKIDAPSSRNALRLFGIRSAGTFTPVAGGCFLTGDCFIDQRVHNWNSDLNASLQLNGIENSDGATAAFAANASINLQGALNLTQIGSGWTSQYSNPTCSGGASTYTYKMVAVDSAGGQAASAQLNTPASCTNPLTSGNPATFNAAVGLFSSSIWKSVVRVDVYRTGGPMATGKIGSITCNANISIGGCNAFVDTGLAASGTLPATDTTGSVKAYNYQTISNCSAVGTAASPSVVSCSAAPEGAVACDVAASAATCVVNTTAVTANSNITLIETAAANTRLGVTCNTGATITIIPSVPIAAISAGTSFTINMPTLTANPACFYYRITN